MFSFLFGLGWTIFSLLFLFVTIVGGLDSGEIIINRENGFVVESSLGFPLVFLSIFVIIGICILVGSIRKFLKDSKTSKNGVLCYGIIKAVTRTGNYVNNRPELKAVLDIINPNTNQVEEVQEVIGFDPYKYAIGSYMICKYYEGDINFERKAEPGEITDSIKDRIKPGTYYSEGQGLNPVETGYTDIEFSEDRMYVTIDGIKYKRV